jgi:hypothetical protein
MLYIWLWVFLTNQTRTASRALDKKGEFARVGVGAANNLGLHWLRLDGIEVINGLNGIVLSHCLVDDQGCNNASKKLHDGEPLN